MPDIGVMWLEIADSYRFLMEREDRIDAEESGRKARAS